MLAEMDLVSLLEKELFDFPNAKLEEVGVVVKVFDGIAQVHGLIGAFYCEVVSFQGGNQGLVLKLDEQLVWVVLLHKDIAVAEREVVTRTKECFKVAVGQGLLGRTVDALGQPIDNLGPIVGSLKSVPIEKPAPGISDRSAINQSFQTGFLAIDAMIPIGKGQRELVLGDRDCGKTSIVTDIIVHQKGKKVVCVYVSIGNKRSDILQLIETLERTGAIEYTIIVDAGAFDSALCQFLAPYVGCSIAEFFAGQGQDAFVVYDDLGNHAVAYRELSLLLRRSPGREAFPGDIFYIHARLLERACKLSEALGGGSLTAMPIIQTQNGDLSAYIPTNLISITDGQIVLDSMMFNQGIRPAINIGASVSRVGVAAQSKAMRKVAGVLKLDLAQYDELAVFAKFGSELDKASQTKLEHGRRAIQLLCQERFVTLQTVEQVLMLFLLNNGYLHHYAVDLVRDFAKQYVSYVQEIYPALYSSLEAKLDINEEDLELLRKAVTEFNLIFINAQ